MNRFTLVFTAVSALVCGVNAQTTNITGTGSETINLSGLSFTGPTGEVAAAVSSLAAFNSTDTAYQGGVGAANDGSLNGDGAVALYVQDVDRTRIQNQDAVISGGDGGSAVSSGSGYITISAMGGDGLSANPASSVNYFGPGGDIVYIDGADIQGGKGGVVEGLANNTLYASGGAAMTAEDMWVSLKEATLQGGDGGDITSVSAFNTAIGGDGLTTGFDGAISNLSSSVTVVGGDGGTINSASGGQSANASGGAGLNHQGLNYFDPALVMTVSGGHYEGGAGGTVTGQSGINVSGGSGFYFNFQKAYITDGEFVGGDGGSALNTVSDAGTAAGGSGLYAFLSDELIIDGGTFTGGAAGSINGVEGTRGAGLKLTDSYVTINGGTFEGLGVWVASLNSSIRNSTLDITGGTFGDIQLSSYSGLINELDISGGSFEDVEFNGTGENTAVINDVTLGDFLFSGSGVNGLAITNSSIGDLNFEGTAVNTLALAGVSSSGSVGVYGGEVTFESWDDSNFTDVTVSDSQVYFENQDFTLNSDASFQLADVASSAYFSQNVDLKGSLDVGFASFTVESNVMVRSGADVSSSIMAAGSGTTGGVITAQSAAIEDGVSWTVINTDTNITKDNLLEGYGILLVSATETNVDASLEASDFTLVNNPEWLFGINGITNVAEDGSYNLYAVYGQQDLGEVFKDYDAELSKAMSDLSNTVNTNSALTDYLGATWAGVADAALDMERGFVRTPEMANALIGLQSVFADQVKERTRSNLRFKKFGSKTSYSPMGTRGPQEVYDNTVQWAEDHLPSYDVSGALRTAADNAPMPSYEGGDHTVGKAYNSSSAGKSTAYDELADNLRNLEIGSDEYKAVQAQLENLTPGTPEYNELRDKLQSLTPGVDDYDAFQTQLRTRTPSVEPIEMPETYQLWGRGYGAHASQDAAEGHDGYDTTYAGGVVGFDKRFEKMLVGLGGGYSMTKVSGNAGNDGDADTLNVMAYWAHNSESFYMDAMVNYAFHDVSTDGIDTLDYTADYDAQTLGISLGMGYGISFLKDKWLLTPEASYLGTYYTRDSYTEESQLATPFPNKNYESYDQWSHLTSVGVTLSMIGVIDSFETELEVQPELRAHWLHEFNADMDADSYMMQGGNGDAIAVALQAREEDLLRLGAGLRIAAWDDDSTAFSLDVDSALGEDYYNLIVSGKVMRRF